MLVVAKSRYLGSSFHHMEKGLEFQVSFSCREVTDPELGIKIAKVENIKVTDNSGDDMSHLIDMERMAETCHQKAIGILMRHTPPEF